MHVNTAIPVLIVENSVVNAFVHYYSQNFTINMRIAVKP